MRRSETDITKQFDRYGKALLEQKKAMAEVITKWSKDRTRHIEDYATSQKRLLDQEFERQKNLLENRRKEFIDDFREQEKKKDNQQLQRLRDECNALKFELVAFQYPERSVPFIQVQTDKQLPGKNPDENSTQTTNEQQSPNIKKEDGDHEPMKSPGAEANSTAEPASASSNKTSRRSSINQTLSDHDLSINNDGDDSKLTFTNNDGTTQKCPTCYMIFPAHMSSADRNQHANEHFS